MRIAVLVKQIPTFEEMALDDDGRLIRTGLALEMNAYCRRAVAQAVELAAGPASVDRDRPDARPAERRGRAAGGDRLGARRRVEIDGVLVTDPAFAGSDTLATARALAAALRLTARSTSCSSAGTPSTPTPARSPPQLAELLDLPFVTGVRSAAPRRAVPAARCEHDDDWVDAEVDLPALLSCAERLIAPCKVDPDGRAAVPAERIRTLTAADLGAGPWGQAGSPTGSGAVRLLEVDREGTSSTARSTTRSTGRSTSCRRGALAGHDDVASRRAGRPPPAGDRTGPASPSSSNPTGRA